MKTFLRSPLLISVVKILKTISWVLFPVPVSAGTSISATSTIFGWMLVTGGFIILLYISKLPTTEKK